MKFFIINYLKRIIINSSKDNTIIFIKNHIEINICDLDIKLNFYILKKLYELVYLTKYIKLFEFKSMKVRLVSF